MLSNIFDKIYELLFRKATRIFLWELGIMPFDLVFPRDLTGECRAQNQHCTDDTH